MARTKRKGYKNRNYNIYNDAKSIGVLLRRDRFGKSKRLNATKSLSYATASVETKQKTQELSYRIFWFTWLCACCSASPRATSPLRFSTERSHKIPLVNSERHTQSRRQTVDKWHAKPQAQGTTLQPLHQQPEKFRPNVDVAHQWKNFCGCPWSQLIVSKLVIWCNKLFTNQISYMVFYSCCVFHE